MSASARRDEAGDAGRPLRLLLFADAHLGHVSAIAGLAQRLRNRGHDVQALCPDERALRHFALFGVAAAVMPELDPAAPSAAGGRRASRAAVMHRTDELAMALNRFDAHAYDLALIDPFLLWIYPLLARSLRCVSLCTKPDLEPGPFVPPWTTGVVPGRGIVRRALVKGAWLGQWVRYGAYRASCGVQEAIHGVSHRSLTLAAIDRAGHARGDLRSRPVPIDMRFRSVGELILHARELDFPRGANASAAHIGPCIPARQSPGASAWPDSGGGPKIFCSLGTEGRAADLADRYCAILSAVEGLPTCRAMIATSDPGLTAMLRDQATDRSGRIVIVDWADSSSVMRQADVVVHHGGANLTKEAVAEGCPMVAMPMRADQPGIAARIAYHGLGAVVTRPRAAEIRGAIAQVSADRAILDRVSRMASAFARYDRERVAERTIERLCSQA